jgi:Ser/Thr protein kinase RdoA (MazF antagonist)
VQILGSTIVDMAKESRLLPAKKIDLAMVDNYLGLRYGITPVETPKLFEGGTESAAWEIVASDRAYILKIFGLHENQGKRIKDEARLYAFLNRHGVRAPRMVPTVEEQLIGSLPFKGIGYPTMLMEKEELHMLEPSTVTRDQLMRVGEATATLHRVMKLYESEFDNETAERVLNDTEGSYERLEKSPYAQKFSGEQMERFKRANEVMLAYLQTHPPADGLEQQLIHGDLGLEHARVLPDGNIYFFDFADRKVSTRADELATFVTTLYQWEDISFERFETLRQWLLEGYQKVTPLAETELREIDREMMVRILNAHRYLLDLSGETYNQHVFEWVRRGYDLGEYVAGS